MIKLMNDEMRLKQEYRDKAREFVENFEESVPPDYVTYTKCNISKSPLNAIVIFLPSESSCFISANVLLWF